MKPPGRPRATDAFLSAPRPKVATAPLGKHKQERLRSLRKASKNAVKTEHNHLPGGLYGYFATALVSRSADYSEIRRCHCCSANHISVHYQGQRRNTCQDRHGRSLDGR